ncbi:MAG: divalent-cation tolerance protein CutA [Betaproteobacteria bacterium]|nr:divalent-cation tolerance protein CutA [Betaproteobacteria bacterium]
MKILLVLTQYPDLASAEKLAALLVERRLAACVNIGSATRSLYHWRGKTEIATEYPLQIKTTDARYSEVEEAIRRNHPYELPEVIAVPLCAGLPEYLDWVRGETSSAES